MKTLTPCPFTKETPNIQFPFDVLGAKSHSLKDNFFATFITGTSGGGKSVKLNTITAGLLDYTNEEGKHAGVVCIDPKRDQGDFLLQYLKRKGQEDRLVTIENGEVDAFWFFEFSHGLGVSDKIDLLSESLTHSAKNLGDALVWRTKSFNIIKGLAKVEQIARDEVLFDLGTWNSWLGKALYVSLHGPEEPNYEEDFYSEEEETQDYLRGAKLQLEALRKPFEGLSFFEAVKEVFSNIISKSLSSGFHHRLYEEVEGVLSVSGNSVGSENPIEKKYTDERIRQWGFFKDSGWDFLTQVTNKDIRTTINCCAFKPERVASLKQLLSSGKVIHFQPDPFNATTTRLIGASIRMLMSGYLRNRDNPKDVTGYICDEFHNYFSTDENCGEAILMSWGRAFRLIPVLATQSIEALEFATQNQLSSSAAVTSLLNNLPNKIAFNSTMISTQKWAEETFGSKGGMLGGNTVSYRPLSSLNTGEHYFLSCSGHKGLGLPISDEELAYLYGEVAACPQPMPK